MVHHRTDSASEIVVFVNASISYTDTTSILLLKRFVSCMCWHSNDPKGRKVAWKAWYEGFQRQIIRDVHRFSLYFDPA